MNRSRKQAGFTLVEVMAALLVFGIGMAGMFALSSALVRMNYFKQHFAQAARLGESKIEELRSSDYDDVTSGNDTVERYRRTWTVTTDTDYEYKVVAVEVNWHDTIKTNRHVALNAMITP